MNVVDNMLQIARKMRIDMAKEFVSKFQQVTGNKEQSKQCASIMANELYRWSGVSYWSDVSNEINNLYQEK